MSVLEFMRPHWPAPAAVRACCTTRAGGTSRGAYASLNLATHVGDDPATVESNRAQVRIAVALGEEPRWVSQVHGSRVVHADGATPDTEADAAWTATAGVPCTVLTADCLPILLCDDRGALVAAAHAGWRGLLDGVIAATVAALRAAGARELLAWVGPGIGPTAYAVGGDMRERFVHLDSANTAWFTEAGGRWHADLPGLAVQQLQRAGVAHISRYAGCTFEEPARFYSYRRDGTTGRMASLIWLTG